MTDDRRSGSDRRADATGGRRGDDRQPGPLEARAIAVIKAAIEAEGLAMADLVARSRLSHGTIWRMLNGYDYRITSLDALAAALRIPPEKLFRAA